MHILTAEPKAVEIQFDSDNIIVKLADGRILFTPLVYFPKLLNATQDQRNNFEISGGGSGLHWENLDEDISVRGLLLGIGDLTA